MNKSDLIRFAITVGVAALLLVAHHIGVREGATRANPTPTEPEMLIIVDSTGVVRDVLTPVACQWRARIRVNEKPIPNILTYLDTTTGEDWMSVMYDY